MKTLNDHSSAPKTADLPHLFVCQTNRTVGSGYPDWKMVFLPHQIYDSTPVWKRQYYLYELSRPARTGWRCGNLVFWYPFWLFEFLYSHIIRDLRMLYFWDSSVIIRITLTKILELLSLSGAVDWTIKWLDKMERLQQKEMAHIGGKCIWRIWYL